MITYNHYEIGFKPFEEALLRRLAAKHGKVGQTAEQNVEQYIYDRLSGIEDSAYFDDEEIREAIIAHWRRVFPLTEIQEVMEEVAASCQELFEKSDGVFIDQLFKWQGVHSHYGHTEIPFSPRVYCGPRSIPYILVEGPVSQKTPILIPLGPGDTTGSKWAWEYASRIFQLGEEAGEVDVDPFVGVAKGLLFMKSYDGTVPYGLSEESIEGADEVIDMYFPDGMK